MCHKITLKKSGPCDVGLTQLFNIHFTWKWQKYSFELVAKVT